LRILSGATVLAGLLVGTHVQAAEKYPFIGKWDCEVATFTFTAYIYNNGEEDLPVKKIKKEKDGSYFLTFSNGYQIGLSGFSKNRMQWFSPESGDSFTCKKLKK
jgi:hypothetical protein